MAWRPYENLIDGELSNRTPGKVTGWMRFFRQGSEPLRVTFDLAGDFHEDICGKEIRLSNPEPSDRNTRRGTYMEGFGAMQQGNVGDITAGRTLSPWNEELARKLMARNELAWDDMRVYGATRAKLRQEYAERYRRHIEAGDLYYPYVPYPYIEWYSEANGRVVLELDPSQVEVLDLPETVPQREKTPRQLTEDARKRSQAFGNFLTGMLKGISRENRKKGGGGKVTGIVVG